MRHLLAILAILFLVGCGEREQRAQAAANVDAGITAAKEAAIEVDQGIVAAIKAAAEAGANDAVAILEGVRKRNNVVEILNATQRYVAPAADVPHAEWPAPTVTPEGIRRDPATFGEIAPPEPKPWGAGVLAGLGTAGMALLWASKRLLPMVPVFGGPVKSLIGTVADVAWAVTAHADQKRADAAQAAVAKAAGTAGDVLDAVRKLDPATLPPALAQALQRPEVDAALAVLSGKPSTDKGA